MSDKYLIVGEPEQVPPYEPHKSSSNGICACSPSSGICVYNFECCNGTCIGANPVTLLPGVCN